MPSNEVASQHKIPKTVVQISKTRKEDHGPEEKLGYD